MGDIAVRDVHQRPTICRSNAQASVGPSVDLMLDTRDSFINASRGWLAKASYRMSFDGFLGADSSWQKVQSRRAHLPAARRPSGRHTLAGWMFADAIVGGVAPYFDLPATGLDTYGRSARGYGEGQFRGERLAYGEIEYRGTLMKNGLLGMVAFVNATTISNLAEDERLFDSVAVGAGAGLRLLINKRSKTNLCFDVGVRETRIAGDLPGGPGSVLDPIPRVPVPYFCFLMLLKRVGCVPQFSTTSSPSSTYILLPPKILPSPSSFAFRRISRMLNG